MERVPFGSNEFLRVKEDEFEVLFFTSKGNLNFNINSGEGINNIAGIREKFGLGDIGYSRQVHSDVIHIYDGVVHTGDALITDKRRIGLGIFTADCVPVMIYDRSKGVIGAVHSGWKGTYDEIALKTIRKMGEEYDSDPSKMLVFIGPHNRKCCYEIGEDVKSLFEAKDIYKGTVIVENGRLNLEKCIVLQCLAGGVSENNIVSSGICTFCSTDYELYSYRRNKDENGRLMSLIFMKD